MTQAATSPTSEYYDADGGYTEHSARTPGIPGTPGNATLVGSGGAGQQEPAQGYSMFSKVSPQNQNTTVLPVPPDSYHNHGPSGFNQPAQNAPDAQKYNFGVSKQTQPTDGEPPNHLQVPPPDCHNHSGDGPHAQREPLPPPTYGQNPGPDSAPNPAAAQAAPDAQKDDFGAMFSSIGSSPSGTRPGAHDKSDSVATVTPANTSAQGQGAAPSQFNNAPLPNGANGVAGTGMDDAPKTTLATRAETAESQLDPQALAKITKAEAKDAKKEVKILNAEGKTQSKMLASASSDLSKQQKLQKSAASEESKALKAHSKAVKVEHKLHSRFLNAKAKYEAAAADVKAKEDMLGGSRQHSQRANEVLNSKLGEVEDMKKHKSVDDREREVKLNELQGTIRQKKSV